MKGPAVFPIPFDTLDGPEAFPTLVNVSMARMAERVASLEGENRALYGRVKMLLEVNRTIVAEREAAMAVALKALASPRRTRGVR